MTANRRSMPTSIDADDGCRRHNSVQIRAVGIITVNWISRVVPTSSKGSPSQLESISADDSTPATARKIRLARLRRLD